MNRSRSLLLSSMLLSATLTACVHDEEVGDMPDTDPPVSECMTDEQCDDGERCAEGACVADCVCPAVDEPVCGADGVTYGNRCQAECVGVEVAEAGECRDVPGECAPGDCGDPPDVAACPDGEGPRLTCERNSDGACGWQIGECSDVCACPENYDPVCGADGQTYGNACEARCARVEVIAEGECRDEPRECRPVDCGPGPRVEPCADGSAPPQECRADDANICTWFVGECPEPCACPDVYDPVCGADGETYGNACEARCAQVEVVAEGECGEPGECREADCGPPPFLVPLCPDGVPPPVECVRGDGGMCGWQIGPCEDEPGECREDECGPAPFLLPVCPDGSPPPQACVRNDAGLCGWQIGECPGECAEDDCGPRPARLPDCPGGGPPPMACQPNDAGICGWQVFECPGDCNCLQVWDPVCGVDGQTYGNACEAGCAGVRIDYEGECRGEPGECAEEECGPQRFLVAPCPDGSPPVQICVRDDAGMCGWQLGECPGECACDRVWDPVCGADGVTYGNACEARCAGIQIDYAGECRGEPAECRPAECGPAPGAPNFECPDGSIGGPVCERAADGVCGWSFRQCPEDCLCPQIWAPVCGVDGMTYGNGCEARCAGVEVAHEGECGEVGMCDPDACGPQPFLIAILCPDGDLPGQECVLGADGVCRWQMGECPDPECGRDACGPPPPVAACPDGDGPSVECLPQDDGACGWVVGQCEDGCLCPQIWEPVCGADGVTYGNGCEADCAGVEVVARGECPIMACVEEACGPPPFLIAPCPDGGVPPQECVPGPDGVCRWQIGECPPFECAPDACGPPPPQVPCDDGIGPSLDCVPRGDGVCGWEIGQCEEPCICPDVWAPVCGADGNTYGNACEARCARVEVAAEGECRVDACGLPADSGPCEAAMRRYYHNAATGQCEVFVYGGCGGNANNFETEEACVDACGGGNAGECAPDECGLAPGAPNVLCDDGSVGGPICERAEDGVCGWNFRDCPPADECGPEDCGPAPRPLPCDDGRAPIQECVPSADGRCGWLTECRADDAR